jgi:hypothetical protein
MERRRIICNGFRIQKGISGTNLKKDMRLVEIWEQRK